jgi:hypothetical protein
LKKKKTKLKRLTSSDSKINKLVPENDIKNDLIQEVNEFLFDENDL